MEIRQGDPVYIIGRAGLVYPDLRLVDVRTIMVMVDSDGRIVRVGSEQSTKPFSILRTPAGPVDPELLPP